MDPLQTWLKSLKDAGKTDDEINILVYSLRNLSAASLDAAILSSLTPEDQRIVEAITDDAQAEEKMKELFELRTGMTVDQFMEKAQQAFIDGTLKTPEPKA